MGFASRLPTSNDPRPRQWRYGPQEPHDDVSALLNGLGFRCQGCKRVTMARFLSGGRCPECAESATPTED